MDYARNKPSSQRSILKRLQRGQISSRNMKVFGGLALLLLVLAIPLTLYLNQQEQDLRQQAAEGGQNICSQDPVDVILVIDTSNSMAGGPLGQAKTGARNFTEKVLSNTNNRIGIATFDNNGGLNLALTSSKTSVINTINGLSTPGSGDGGTCLECAIDKEDNRGPDVKSAFSSPNPNTNTKRHVVILTDGKINRWMQNDGDIVGSTRAADEQQARDQALGAVNRVKSAFPGTIFSVLQYGGTANDAWLKNQIAQIPTGSYFSQLADGDITTMYNKFTNLLVGGGTITGSVFDDVNNDLVPNTGDAGLPGVLVTLRKAGQTADYATTRTNSVGVYSFSNLCGGNWRVISENVSGYKRVVPANTDYVDVSIGNTETKVAHFVFDKLPDQTTAVCEPTTVDWNQNVSLGVTLKSSTGTPLTGKQILWQPSISATPMVVVNPAQSTTDASGIASTTVTVKPDSTAFQGAVMARFTGDANNTAATCQLGINYTPPAPELTFTGNPTSVDSGQSSTLTWTTANVTSCKATNGWTGDKTATGGTESTGPLTTAKTYTLTCSGPGGEVSEDVTINVNYPPPTLTFTGNPTTIRTGQSSTLTWNAQNVTGCEATNGWTGDKNATGTQSTGTLTQTTTYVLTCSGQNGNDVSQTVTITVTPIGQTVLNLSLLMHGIGAAGDNVVLQPAPCRRTNGQIANPTNCLSNQAPLRPQRDVKVEILNDDNQVEATSSGRVTYDNSTGTFRGSVTLPESWESGVYNIKVTSPQYLRRQVTGFHNIPAEGTYNVPVSNLISSDVDKDNKLTILDYNMIIDCYTFPGLPPTCSQGAATEVDTNDDGKNDEFDENLFRRDLIVQYGQ